MRPFHSGIKLVGRNAICRSACHARPSNLLVNNFNLVASRRWNSSDRETVTWTPHTFKTGGNSSTMASTPLTTPKPAQKHRVYIALGSNLGDRIGWIEKACNMMGERGIRVKRTSCLWETAPMYVVNQENFVNGACEVKPVYRIT